MQDVSGKAFLQIQQMKQPPTICVSLGRTSCGVEEAKTGVCNLILQMACSMAATLIPLLFFLVLETF